jgi:hypothetical protein
MEIVEIVVKFTTQSTIRKHWRDWHEFRRKGTEDICAITQEIKDTYAGARIESIHIERYTP